MCVSDYSSQNLLIQEGNYTIDIKSKPQEHLALLCNNSSFRIDPGQIDFQYKAALLKKAVDFRLYLATVTQP